MSDGYFNPCNDKKFCPSCSISQELYIIWLPFMIHMYKVIISPGVFIFSKFFLFFLAVRGGGKRAKWSKMRTNSVCHAQYLRNHMLYDCHLWYICIKWYLQAFFHFFKKFFLFVRGEVKGQKWPKMRTNSVCHTQYLRNHMLQDSTNCVHGDQPARNMHTKKFLCAWNYMHVNQSKHF